MIELGHPDFSIRRQCELVGLSRSTFYYEPASETEFNLHLMRLVDAEYLKRPFYGWRRMTHYLQSEGYEVNHKRVRRLMQRMGLQAIYPKPSSLSERDYSGRKSQFESYAKKFSAFCIA